MIFLGLSPSSQYRVTVRAKHLRAPGQAPPQPPPEEAPGAYTDFRTLAKGLPDPPQVNTELIISLLLTVNGNCILFYSYIGHSSRTRTTRWNTSCYLANGITSTIIWSSNWLCCLCRWKKGKHNILNSINKAIIIIMKFCICF